MTDTSTDPEAHGLELGIGTRLELSFHSLADEMRQDRADRMAREARAARLIPVVRPLAGSGICPASGTLFFSIGKPELGRLFEVRSLAVGGPTWTAAPGGEGAIVVSAMNPPLDLSLLNLRDVITEAFPQVAFYSSNQVTAQAGEHLIVVITGGTSGAQYAASGIALDYPSDAFLRATI